ncbi:hypothetical protein [uncultured Ruegeria sp.]|uniref:hypothetical protein n=1 Tax=uncultured Ruegeria sp. TaxID=259304 RepID=UPI002608020B|nr:hypothetical protein [uncultured Ruegeria sp.]
MQISALGISFGFNAAFGLMDSFCVKDQGRSITPLHRAPWVGSDEEMPPDAAPHLAVLGGDFFCAPFGAREGFSPLHGWPPNSRWHVTQANGGILEAELERRVFDAQLRKRLVVRDGHPFVYQSHTFDGGNGRVSCANHASVSVRNGAHIRTSPKAIWETPATPQETDPTRGRSALVYPTQSENPKAFPATDGMVNLTSYPWRDRNEDFVIGIEAKGSSLGWTAVSRLGSGDLFLSLRNPVQLPMTMLWHSNGGRDYPPWSARHVGCLGVEEGAAAHLLGISKEADLCGPGEIELGNRVVIRHVIGAIDWPTEDPVDNVVIDGEALVVTGETGAISQVPFDVEFLNVEN